MRDGGFTNGGLNFDAKTRRGSNTTENIFLAHIAGMDAFVLGLRNAYKIIEICKTRCGNDENKSRILFKCSGV